MNERASSLLPEGLLVIAFLSSQSSQIDLTFFTATKKNSGAVVGTWKPVMGAEEMLSAGLNSEANVELMNDKLFNFV